MRDVFEYRKFVVEALPGQWGSGFNSSYASVGKSFFGHHLTRKNSHVRVEAFVGSKFSTNESAKAAKAAKQAPNCESLRVEHSPRASNHNRKNGFKPVKISVNQPQTSHSSHALPPSFPLSSIHTTAQRRVLSSSSSCGAAAASKCGFAAEVGSEG